MQVITDVEGCPARLGRSTVVTIGAYDGVHLGHRALIARVRSMAQELSSAAAVVTFDRHPATVVRPESAPLLLTDLEQKLELLAATGLDSCLVVPFDEERAREPAEDFVRDTLVACLAPRAVVVGHDFHFGHRRRGNVALLQEMGAKLGFDVLGISLVSDEPDTGPVSSTRIRRLLEDGELEKASSLLGRPHEVRGVVRKGDGRGRDLGFPTANVAVPEEILLPADGIYAGWYERPSGDVRMAALSVGRRPTFYEGAARILEAYLLDFDDDLYGEGAKVRFVGRIGAQKRYDSVDQLIAQMGRDVEATRHLLLSSRS